MKSKILILAVGLSLANSGCFFRYAARNALVCTGRMIDECCARKKYCATAETYWKNYERDHCETKFSEDYGKGYQRGFADYLDANGTGLPPISPPLCYRTTCFQTVQGHHAIDDWYAGFAHGAADARASGLRELVEVPMSAPAVTPEVRRQRNAAASAKPGDPSQGTDVPMPRKEAANKASRSNDASLLPPVVTTPAPVPEPILPPLPKSP